MNYLSYRTRNLRYQTHYLSYERTHLSYQLKPKSALCSKSL